MDGKFAFNPIILCRTDSERNIILARRHGIAGSIDTLCFESPVSLPVFRSTSSLEMIRKVINLTCLGL